MVRTFSLALAFSTLLASVAIADEKPTLTIYTYDGFTADWAPGPGLKTGFEANCNCILNWVGADSSIGALRKVQLEGDTTEADIVLGLDTAIVAEARATGLFTNHSVDTSALKLPNDWHSDDFVPFDYGYFAFVYNTELLPNPPQSFKELAEADDDLKIVIQDPRSATPGLGLVLWAKAALGDETSEIWPQIAPHIVTVTRSWSEAYSLFLKEEADMVLSYTTSPAYHLIAEEDKRFAAAPFTEGHYTQIEVAGILKSSPNKQLADDFLAYLITPEAQAIIPTTNWMYPVADISLPDGFDTLIAPQPALLLDDAIVGENSGAWIAEMLAALK